MRNTLQTVVELFEKDSAEDVLPQLEKRNF